MPRFDYKAAKASGYTDDQIKQYLESKRAAGVDVWIDKADYQPGATAPPPGPPKLAGGYFEGPSKYQENFGGDPLNYINVGPLGMSVPLGRGIDAFPQMGAAVFGPPTGMAGAGVGAASMDMLRRSLRGMPMDLKASGWEGGKQALLYGAGEIAGSGLQAAAPAMSKVPGTLGRFAQRVMGNSVARNAADLLPIGGALTHGVGGAAAGFGTRLAGQAALKVALSPKTEAFLGSMAFRSFARHSPQAANQIIQLLASKKE